MVDSYVKYVVTKSLRYSTTRGNCLNTSFVIMVGSNVSFEEYTAARVNCIIIAW